MKKIIMIHGWGGGPEGGWLDWLKKKLEETGWKVEAPEMPDTDEPKIDLWVNKLKDVAESIGADKDTYFVGHSVGCQTILRYLEKLPKDKKVGGAVFVAGWFTLKGLEDEEKEIAKPWVETPINFEKVKKHNDKFIAIFSDNDPYVPLSDEKLFRKDLNAKTMILNDQEHFNEIIEFNEVLNSLLEISK